MWVRISTRGDGAKDKWQVLGQEQRLKSEHNFFSKKNRINKIKGQNKEENKNKQEKTLICTAKESEREKLIGDMQICEVSGNELIIKEVGRKVECMEKGEWKQREE